MMKKISSKVIYIIILIAIIIGIISVITSVYNNKKIDDNKLQITTTIFPYYSIADEICSAESNIVMLIKPGSESHTYEPTPEDIISIKNSDVFIYTGGESDKWVETIISSIDTHKTKIIKVMDYIEPVQTARYGNISYDEHVWTSLNNTCIISKKICDFVCEINPELKDEYVYNTELFIKELNYLDAQFKKAIENSNKTVVFADRFPFLYFAKDYNLNYVSAFENCSEEAEPSIQNITKIINTIKQQNIKNVFYIEFSNQKIADSICEETGSSKLLFHSCHNISQDDFNNGVSYLSLMKNNLKNLKEALN